MTSEARADEDYFDACTAGGRSLRFCRAGADSAIPPNMVSLMRPMDDGETFEISERDLESTLLAIQEGSYDGPSWIVMRPKDWDEFRDFLMGNQS